MVYCAGRLSIGNYLQCAAMAAVDADLRRGGEKKCEMRLS
jgi:hypothetical protein